MPPLPSPLLAASLAILLAATLAAGVPSLLARLPRDGRASLFGAALVALAFLLVQLDARALDPYTLAILAAASWASLETLRRAADRPLGPPDLAIWLLLWIPFDLRWYSTLFPGGEHAGYPWCALALNVLAALGFGRLRALPGFDARLLPGRRDLAVAALAFLALMVLILGPSLALGFTHFPGRREVGLAEALFMAPNILVTIAVPEELYFRATLQAGLEARLAATRLGERRGRALGLALASLAFGLMHWNNVESLAEKLVYLALASTAGAVYGLAYRRAGSLIAAALVHAAVDWVWYCFLT
jgi:membrane protease YdiL (CAAX protease family)